MLAEGRSRCWRRRGRAVDGRLIDAVRPGDLVLVHAGVALSTPHDERRGRERWRADRIPLSLHRSGGAGRGRPHDRARGVRPGQDAESGPSAPPHSSAATTQCERAGRGHGGSVQAGGRLFAFGNGGSATDAEGTVELFRTRPTAAAARPVARGRPGGTHRPLQRRRFRARVLAADHRPRRPSSTSPSGSPRAATRSTCSAPSRKRRAAGCSRSACAATKGRPWR